MPFPAQCEYAAKLGYDGLEIAPYTLSEEPHRMGSARVAAARAAAEDAGIAVTGLHWLLVKPAGLSISSKDQKTRERTIDVMLALIDTCAELGGKYLVHGSPQQRRVEAGGARAESRRGLLHRSPQRRIHAPHQHAGRSRADGPADQLLVGENHAGLQRGRPHGEGAARRPGRALGAERRDRARAGE